MTLARSFASVVAAAATVLAVACGSTHADDDGNESGAGASGNGASGGFGNNEGAGGSSGGDDKDCAATSAETAKAKADIIFVIDNSGSMTNEMDQIKQNVNAFASKILNVGLDAHVIFIVRKAESPTDTGNVICVPEPLAGPNCADKPPTFFHVPQSVASTNSLSLILSTYDSQNANLAWKDHLRFESTKIFIEVTDDRSAMKHDDFDKALLAKDPPGMFGTAEKRKYIFHSIVNKPFNDPIPSTNRCPTAASGNSVEYQLLSQLTGGLVDEVCKTDYSGVLDNIATDVVQKLGCELTYPTGEAADPTKLAVEFTPPGGAPQQLTQVTDASKCGQVQDGWYYDDNANPTKIILCPTMCTTANEAPGAKLQARVGCRVPEPR